MVFSNKRMKGLLQFLPLILLMIMFISYFTSEDDLANIFNTLL